MKVLLVDDEQKFVTMLSKRLELRGISTVAFFSGNEAIEYIEQDKQFDVAILDVKMPGIGGIELKQKLSVLAPDLKFIFLTGHGSGTDFKTASVDTARYLPKPINIENLIETLNLIMENDDTSTND